MATTEGEKEPTLPQDFINVVSRQPNIAECRCGKTAPRKQSDSKRGGWQMDMWWKHWNTECTHEVARDYRKRRQAHSVGKKKASGFGMFAFLPKGLTHFVCVLSVSHLPFATATRSVSPPPAKRRRAEPAYRGTHVRISPHAHHCCAI